MSEMTHLPTFSYVNGNFRAEISLNRIADNFNAAQAWLGDRVLEDCRACMPLLTGSLQQRSHTEDGGRRVVFPGPYARFLYGGKVMVDPETGSPWARKGAKKVLTDRPLKFQNPSATDHWFDTAKARNGDYWIAGVKRIAGGKSE